MTFTARWTILICSFFGIADSAYLTDQALRGVPPTCSIGGADGCRTVAESAYSHLFGIPLGIYGIAFYTAIFVLIAVVLLWPHRHVQAAIQAFAVLGVGASLIFMGIQFFLIHAMCIYCESSAALTVFILIAAFWRLPQATWSPSHPPVP
ncbi:MAG: hypothetical protein B7X04_01290 [Parcubacteria group bacterium 21-54-25]|nr:MAG: hypothetical protein B7X04_01290 [Parcubacteria group bacterium 21-54-25]HQU07565.1 vitamin K epoxide reductase family protein [Candidatus Paceibacterota bacterium]